MEGERKAEMLDEAQQIFVYDEAAVQDLKSQWEKDKAAGAETELQSRVSYAAALSQSPNTQDKNEAINMLTESLWECQEASYRAEVLMQLCMVNYSMGAFEVARTWCSELLQMYPDHQQVKDLYNAIVFRHVKQREFQNQMMWAAIGAGAAATAAVLFAVSRKGR